METTQETGRFSHLHEKDVTVLVKNRELQDQNRENERLRIDAVGVEFEHPLWQSLFPNEYEVHSLDEIQVGTILRGTIYVGGRNKNLLNLRDYKIIAQVPAESVRQPQRSFSKL